MNDDDYRNLVFLIRQTPERMKVISETWTDEEYQYAISLMHYGATLVEQQKMPKRWLALVRLAQQMREDEINDAPVEDLTQAKQVLDKFRL